MPAAAESRRCIALAGRQVDYLLCRSRRKRIGLTIDHRGLRVGVPTRATVGEVEAALHRHAGWVLEKLRIWQERQAAIAIRLEDGARWPWLGGEAQLRLAAGGRSNWSDDGWVLTLGQTPGRPLAIPLERALRQQARQVLAGRLAAFAAVLGVPTPPLSLSSARTRWGSCNSRGEIRLNWRLAFFPLTLIDYVVAHELAHLKEMNHSPRFWSVVESLCPDWRRRRVELRQRAATLPVFEE